jgi:hypothetical protein
MDSGVRLTASMLTSEGSPTRGSVSSPASRLLGLPHTEYGPADAAPGDRPPSSLVQGSVSRVATAEPACRRRLSSHHAPAMPAAAATTASPTTPADRTKRSAVAPRT